MPKYCEGDISLSCRVNVIMRQWSPSKREEGELVPSTAASSCKRCCGWALQVVFALWKVGTSVVQSSPHVNQHRDVP